MPVTAESIPNEPIVVIHFIDPITPVEVSDPHHPGNIAVEECLKQYPLVIRIMDFSKQNIANFGAMAVGMASDPYIRNLQVKTIGVGTQELVKLSAQAITTQKQYGQIPIQLFESMEEALKEAQRLIANK